MTQDPEVPDGEGADAEFAELFERARRGGLSESERRRYRDLLELDAAAGSLARELEDSDRAAGAILDGAVDHFDFERADALMRARLAADRVRALGHLGLAAGCSALAVALALAGRDPGSALFIAAALWLGGLMVLYVFVRRRAAVLSATGGDPAAIRRAYRSHRRAAGQERTVLQAAIVLAALGAGVAAIDALASGSWLRFAALAACAIVVGLAARRVFARDPDEDAPVPGWSLQRPSRGSGRS